MPCCATLGLQTATGITRQADTVIDSDSPGVYKVQTVVLRGDVSPLPGPGTAAAPGLMDAAKGLIASSLAFCLLLSWALACSSCLCKVHIYHVTSLAETPVCSVSPEIA